MSPATPNCAQGNPWIAHKPFEGRKIAISASPSPSWVGRHGHVLVDAELCPGLASGRLGASRLQLSLASSRSPRLQKLQEVFQLLLSQVGAVGVSVVSVSGDTRVVPEADSCRLVTGADESDVVVVIDVVAAIEDDRPLIRGPERSRSVGTEPLWRYGARSQIPSSGMFAYPSELRKWVNLQG
jgi:hypothetical protein